MYDSRAFAGCTTVHSEGGVSRNSTSERAMVTVRPRTVSCTSLGVRPTTEYHAPARKPWRPGVSKRAH